jgi:hypothetical protein
VTPPAQRPVSGFAVATLVLGITGIVLPAIICGIVAIGQLRAGTHSGKNLVVAGLLISAMWLVLLASYVAYLVAAWPH